MKDVPRIHQRTSRHLCFETIIERSLIGEAVLRQPCAGKAGQPPRVKAINLSLLAEVKVYRSARQSDRTAVAVLKVWNATFERTALRNAVSRPICIEAGISMPESRMTATASRTAP